MLSDPASTELRALSELELEVRLRSPPRWAIPAVEIDDAPRFRYRGVLLDVARYYYPPEFIEKVIDLLALYKLNTLHLHLTDDQGWRLEIKKYPTQDRMRHIVAYAAARHITIIPEIEMPGHAQAALAAYPELSCTGKSYEVSPIWDMHEEIPPASRWPSAALFPSTACTRSSRCPTS